MSTVDPSPVLFGLTELAARKIPALGIAGATAGK